MLLQQILTPLLAARFVPSQQTWSYLGSSIGDSGLVSRWRHVPQVQMAVLARRQLCMESSPS